MNYVRSRDAQKQLARTSLGEGFLHYQLGRGGVYLEGLLHRGAYFRNFTVCVRWSESELEQSTLSSMGLQVEASLAKHFL